MKKVFKLFLIVFSLILSIVHPVNKNEDFVIEEPRISYSKSYLASPSDEEIDFTSLYKESVKGVVTCLSYVLAQSPSGTVKTIGSWGSGFFYKETELYYYIMTNCHVVDKAVEVHIVTYTGQEIKATVVGKDSIQDCAVIRVLKSQISGNIKVLDLAKNSNDEFYLPEVGDPCYAIGTPANQGFVSSLTVGMVSGVNRILVQDDDLLWEQTHAIQIDCHINGGNSGGPLFNTKGEVIGVNTVKLTNNNDLYIEGLNFALPIHDMNVIADNIIPKFIGIISSYDEERPYLSETNKMISVAKIKLATRYQYGLENITKGVCLLEESTQLSANSYSLITGIDGHEITNTGELKWYLIEKKVGDFIDVEIRKNDGTSLKEKEIVRIKLTKKNIGGEK